MTILDNAESTVYIFCAIILKLSSLVEEVS